MREPSHVYTDLEIKSGEIQRKKELQTQSLTAARFISHSKRPSPLGCCGLLLWIKKYETWRIHKPDTRHASLKVLDNNEESSRPEIHFISGLSQYRIETKY